MIKGRSQMQDGTPAVLLGLSAEHLVRLMADEPIRVNLKDLGYPPMVVIIVGGKTDDDIVCTLTEQGLLNG